MHSFIVCTHYLILGYSLNNLGLNRNWIVFSANKPLIYFGPQITSGRIVYCSVGYCLTQQLREAQSARKNSGMRTECANLLTPQWLYQLSTQIDKTCLLRSRQLMCSCKPTLISECNILNPKVGRLNKISLYVTNIHSTIKWYILFARTRKRLSQMQFPSLGGNKLVFFCFSRKRVGSMQTK